MAETTKPPRTHLLEQHDHLRELFDAVLVLADHYIAGQPVTDALSSKLVEIRTAFSAHNELEASLLEPLLLSSGEWGPARLLRMVEEHANEHAAFTAFLARPLDELAPALADFLEEIEAHMAAEERTFLSEAVEREIGRTRPSRTLPS